MRPTLRFASVGLALLAACGSEWVTEPSRIAGTYTLRTVNGQAPPRLLTAGANSRLEITAGRMSLSPDGMAHQETDVRTTTAAQVTAGSLHSFGTYVLRGNRVIVRWNGGGSDNMPLSGSTLTQLRDGLTLVYQR